MRKIRKIIIGASLTLLATLGAFFICQEIIVRTLVFPKIEEQQDELVRGVPGFLQDQKLLEKIEFFRPSPGKKNAALYLNSIVRWEGTVYPAARVPANAVVAIDVGAKIDDWNDWPKGYERWNRSDASTDWMSALHQYDHWDLEENNLLAEGLVKALLSGQLQVWEYLQGRPKPFYADLPYFSKVRIAVALQARQPLAGLRDVRQLAQLAYSTERVAGALTALAVLEVEERAYDWMTQTKVIDPGAWKPLGKEVFDAARRVLSRGEQYFGIYTPDWMFRLLFRESGVRVGRCHAIDAATLPISFYEPHLKDPFPLERDYSARFRALTEIATRSNDGCRLRFVKRFWQVGLSSYGRASTPMTFDWRGLHLLSKKIPYVRNVAGLTLSVVGSKNLLTDL